MKKTSKTYAKRQRSRRKRQRRGDVFLLIIVGALGIYLFALKYWEIFLWCVGGLLLLLLLYIAYRIMRHIKKQQKKSQQTEVVRDSRYISPQLRKDVWAKCGGQCVQCQSRSLLEYDHIIPISRGGATSYANLQILCRSCNRHKSDHI